MISIKDLLKNIRIQIKKTPQKRSEELIDPSGHEYGLRHGNGAFILCRDDKVVELNAGGGTSVVVDGPGQSVGIKSSGITLDGQAVQFKVPVDKFYIGYQALNPYWLTTNPVDVISPFIKAPLHARLPVIANGINPLDNIFVSITPTLPVVGVATGPMVPMSTLFDAQPLFGLNQQLLLLSRNLGEVIKNLTSIGV